MDGVECEELHPSNAPLSCLHLLPPQPLQELLDFPCFSPLFPILALYLVNWMHLHLHTIFTLRVLEVSWHKDLPSFLAFEGIVGFRGFHLELSFLLLKPKR